MRKSVLGKIGLICVCVLAVSLISSVATNAQTNDIENRKVGVSCNMANKSTQLTFYANDSDITQPELIEKVKVETKTYKKQYKFKDGTIYKEVKYTIPVLTGESEGIATINAYYKKLLDKWKKNSTKDLEEAKLVVKENKLGGYYGDDADFKVKYNKNGYISILHSGYYYAMGAHGSPYYEAHTFDLNTGNELKLKDIMSGTDKQIKKRIYNAFAKDIKKNKEKYFDNALKVLEKSVSAKTKEFYLTNSNIVFYDNSGNIAPYAAGLITAKISYKNTSFFKIKFN